MANRKEGRGGPRKEGVYMLVTGHRESPRDSQAVSGGRGFGEKKKIRAKRREEGWEEGRALFQSDVVRTTTKRVRVWSFQGSCKGRSELTGLSDFKKTQKRGEFKKKRSSSVHGGRAAPGGLQLSDWGSYQGSGTKATDLSVDVKLDGTSPRGSPPSPFFYRRRAM